MSANDDKPTGPTGSPPQRATTTGQGDTDPFSQGLEMGSGRAGIRLEDFLLWVGSIDDPDVRKRLLELAQAVANSYQSANPLDMDHGPAN